MDHLALMAFNLKIQTAIIMIRDEKGAIDTSSYQACIQTHEQEPYFSVWDKAKGIDETATAIIKNGEIVFVKYGTLTKVDFYLYKKKLMQKEVV